MQLPNKKVFKDALCMVKIYLLLKECGVRDDNISVGVLRKIRKAVSLGKKDKK